MAKVEEQTRNAFDFIEKLYVETSYLIREVESHLQEEDFEIGRPSGYGVTMTGSSGLEPSNVRKWLRKRLAVFFRPKQATERKRGTTTTAFAPRLKVLILLIDYHEKKSGEPTVFAACLRDIKHKSSAKFEYMMSTVVDRADKIFGSQPRINYRDGACSFKGRFFRQKLFSIKNSDDIREKLVEPMLKLCAES